jgi:plastocyanin
MANKYSILKNSPYLLCFIFLLSSCTSVPEKNGDIVNHDVTEEKDKVWNSGPLAPGESWSLVVTENTDYYCSIHLVMKGKLIVQ